MRRVAGSGFERVDEDPGLVGCQMVVVVAEDEKRACWWLSRGLKHKRWG